MAKSSRVKRARTSLRKPARKTARPAARRSGSKTRHPAATSASRSVRQAPRARASAPAPKPAAKPEVPPQPQVPARKPTYHEAVSMYERGLQALQRRDFAAAADALRSVIEHYPDERELLERARLYLKVCERELEPKEPAPKSADELVAAATVALNAADESAAVQHLSRALAENPRHDYAHYMMAVASARRGDSARAFEHLRRAVSLNPENRSLAKQDPEFDALRDAQGFRGALATPPSPGAQAQPRPAVVRPRKIRR